MKKDTVIFNLIEKEKERQQNGIEAYCLRKFYFTPGNEGDGNGADE